MGQKSNITTIRKFLQSINLLTYSSNEFLIGFNFLQNFQRFCQIKNIIIVNPTLNFVGNKAYFVISIFVRSAKLKKLKKRVRNKFKKSSLDKKNLLPVFKQFANFLLHNLKKLRVHLLNLKVVLLNKELMKKRLFLRSLYLRNQFVRDSLFPRRYNLFFDFLKISCLFSFKKVDAKVFLFILGQCFKFLPKQKHARFFSFINKLFKLFFKLNKQMLGIKLLICGRLKGKLRKKKFYIQSGAIPNQTISKDIQFSKLHVFSRYGVFGFKLWSSINL